MADIDKIDDKITTIGFFNNILESFIKDLTYIKKIQNYFLEIFDTIPHLLKIQDNDILSKKFIYNGTEFILLILSIIIINRYSHDTTPENIIYCLFVILLLLNLIHTTYLYLFYRNTNKQDINGFFNIIFFLIYKIPLYLIVFVFSFILKIIINIPNFIKVLFSNLNDLIFAAFSKLKNMLRDPEETKILYKYSSLYLIIFIIIIILYYASFDPSALSTNAFKYTFMIAIPLIIILYFVFPISQSNNSYFKILSIAIVFSFFFALIYFYTKSNSATFQIVEYITIIIGIMMIITGLSIIFYIMSNYFKSLLGWEGFITYFIFYIPCLFIDFVKYILNEFHSTSTPIIILLIIEIILLILYIYLPLILSKIKWTKNNVLLPNSAFLDIKQNISNSELNKAPKFINHSLSKPIYNQNYSFSMWIYLNPQSQSFIGYSKESQIFNYGEGKPKITYYNDMTTVSNNFGSSGFDKFKIYFSNSTSPVALYKFTLPSQKWNNIVVNFSSVKADLFVNGKIEKTYIYQGNTPTYDPIDFITIGDNLGLDGAICNIVYYPYPLSLMEIVSHYNLLSLKNPPTF